MADPTIDNYDGSDFISTSCRMRPAPLSWTRRSSSPSRLDDVDRVQAVNGGALPPRAAAPATSWPTSRPVPPRQDRIRRRPPVDRTTITSAAKAYEHLVDLSVLLDESDVPEFGRWAVVSPAFYGVLQKDDRFVKSGAASGAATLANGVVGSAAGFTVLKSNNIPAAVSGTSSSNKFVLAGTSIATTLAEQIDKVEAVRLERSFGDGVKGLHVYGAKVLADLPGRVGSADQPGLIARLVAGVMQVLPATRVPVDWRRDGFGDCRGVGREDAGDSR